MKLLRILRASIRSLGSRPSRSLMIVAVVALGIATVFVTQALGRGAEAETLKGMNDLRPQLLVVRPELLKKQVARKQAQGLVTTLRTEDYLAIAALAFVEKAAPAIEGMIKVRSRDAAFNAKVSGSTADFLRVRNFALLKGRFIQDDDERLPSRIAVIGTRVQQALFQHEDPIGQQIHLRGIPFEVVGTLQPKGVSDDGADNDNLILVPLRAAQNRLFNSRFLTTLFVLVADGYHPDAAEHQIRSLLQQRHRLGRLDRPDDFAIQNQIKLRNAQQDMATSIQGLTLGLSAVSLLIAGSSVLALNLLAIRDRTPEVGLRMAVGARPRDILWQMLAEVVLLSLVGGGLGSVVGLAATWVARFVTQWPAEVSWQTWLIANGLALLIGAVSGVQPARKAARLFPVQALGQE